MTTKNAALALSFSFASWWRLDDDPVMPKNPQNFASRKIFPGYVASSHCSRKPTMQCTSDNKPQEIVQSSVHLR